MSDAGDMHYAQQKYLQIQDETVFQSASVPAGHTSNAQPNAKP